MTVESDRSRLAALIDGKDRALLAAFLRDEGTDFALKRLPITHILVMLGRTWHRA
ncbi:UNVERIFIED_ORG: hypothetical protein M2438_005364 [Methylobacterium sp. SuP10 SLI 274]|nr:hypothetical protein [Methylorubrum extorquens]MCP1551531.1 hypothetical protein [Methylorubrum zatmanii]MDF9861048.1 hypothetical protein [Methylorubrum pseudosasae]MDH6640118.1 hypothetical protein [Methylobacterium sp. SuP10 SLI 274]MCP1556468.1 hypothetical protein [Methylorubrum extorquens]